MVPLTKILPLLVCCTLQQIAVIKTEDLRKMRVFKKFKSLTVLALGNSEAGFFTKLEEMFSYKIQITVLVIAALLISPFKV